MRDTDIIFEIHAFGADPLGYHVQHVLVGRDKQRLLSNSR